MLKIRKSLQTNIMIKLFRYFCSDIWYVWVHYHITTSDARRHLKGNWDFASALHPALDGLVTVRNTSPVWPLPWEGNLVAAAGSCSGLMVKHPWPLLEISLSDFRRLATLNMNTYLPTYACALDFFHPLLFLITMKILSGENMRWWKISFMLWKLSWPF